LSEKSVWMPGGNATLRGIGYKVFWAYPTIVVQDKPDLIALHMAAGVLGKDTDHRPAPQELLCSPEKINVVDTVWNRTDVLFLIVPGESFSIYLMWNTGTQNLDCFYINLQEPIQRTKIGFDTMDQMLDVVVSPDMTEWRWKDADEFAEAERIGFYSHARAHEIWAEGEKALKLLTSRRRSLYEAWKAWRPQPEWGIPELSPLWDKPK
jgi:predicted RNA-binding protein associated with RNAse of E/G family